MGTLLARLARRHWHLVGALLMLGYFAYHGLHGERGLVAWGQKTGQLSTAKTELRALEQENGKLAATVDALQPDRADADLLEEQLRHLGYIGRGEVIVMPPRSHPDGR